MQQNTQQDRRVDIKEEVRIHAVLWEMFRLLIFGLTSVYFFHREVAPKMCFYDKWWTVTYFVVGFLGGYFSSK